MPTRHLLLGTATVLIGICALALPAGAATEALGSTAAVPVLTLKEALRRTLDSNPDLAAAADERRAAAAERRQAGRRPNPELGVSLENAFGSGPYQESDAGELTIELSTPIELGGKRRLRQEAANLALDLAATAQTETLAATLAATRQRYLALLAAQEQLQLAREQEQAANQTLRAAEERISAGKAPRIDRLRLQGAASIATLAVTREERALELARQALAATWDASSADFGRVEGDLATLPELPELATLEELLEQTPVAARARLNTAQSRNQLAQARAGRLPDPSVTVGWRQFEESNDHALVLGVALPLPLFNPGQDAVAITASRLQATLARARSARNQAQLELRSAWQALAGARAEADLFQEKIVPDAAESFAAADFGYRAGKFGLIELLDAQRTLFEARQRHLAAALACHLAASEVERLLASDLPSPPSTQPSLP